MEKETNKRTINYRLHLMDAEYKESSNLRNYVVESQNFYNGDQYPNDNYRNMVRVTMNFCSFASNLKASKIVGTQMYITFTADDNSVDCGKLRVFDEYNLAKLNDKTENFQTALDAENNGTAIYGYRWDDDEHSYKGIYRGGLVGDQMDILRFAVANPYLDSLQNQKWVMWWKDEDVDAIREIVDYKDEKTAERVRNAIVPDNFADDDADKREHVNHGLATIYMRYFRIDGEVYSMCSTRTVDLWEYPHAMNPRLWGKVTKEVKEAVKDIRNEDGQRVEDYAIDPQDPSFQTYGEGEMSASEYQKSNEKFYLYPFAKFAPLAIKNSFYGRSDIKPMVSIQKGVNFALSMMLKCVENNAYNKIFAKEGALGGQEITNEPGQVVTDFSNMTNGWGIKFAESQPMPNGVADFTDRLFSMTRVVYGFNDVMDGSVTNQDLSGYAVQQMIKQANSSIEQHQQLFWRFCKEKAAIRLMFYKHYVDEARFAYELEDYEVEDRQRALDVLAQRQMQLSQQGQSLEIGDIPQGEKVRKTQIRTFKSDEIYGTSFDISIDVMQGLADSKLAEAQMWDTLIMNGNIQSMEPEMLEMYLEANPTVSERTKSKLKHIVEKEKRSENFQLKQKLTEAANMIKRLTDYAGQLEAQSGQKSAYISGLEKEFTQKIGVANKIIASQQRQAKSQEQTSAQKSANATGNAAAYQQQ